MPRVSVLLPVRDALPTLADCLRSLSAQTLEDHEVVAVDDGSRDGSAERLEAHARTDPRLRGVRTEVSGGGWDTGVDCGAGGTAEVRESSTGQFLPGRSSYWLWGAIRERPPHMATI